MGNLSPYLSCRRRLRWCITLVALLVSSPLFIGDVGAEEHTYPIKIGALTPSWGPTPPIVGLRDGLLELGYRENEQFVIGVRFTQGDMAALPAAARELTEHGVDIIFADYDDAAKAAQMATSQIPSVFAGVRDPLGLGLIQSFARPGGNLTGVTHLDLELNPKRLELFHEIVPSLKRVLFPYDAADTYAVAAARMYREAARGLGIVLVERTVQTPEGARVILTQIQKGEVDGILKPPAVSLNIPGVILEATGQRGIPTMFDAAFWVERGGLASYGPDLYASGRQATRLMDKNLKGTKPAEIPVEVNSKVEFVINLKVANALGLTIAPEVLYRADRIIR